MTACFQLKTVFCDSAFWTDGKKNTLDLSPMNVCICQGWEGEHRYYKQVTMCLAPYFIILPLIMHSSLLWNACVIFDLEVKGDTEPRTKIPSWWCARKMSLKLSAYLGVHWGYTVSLPLYWYGRNFLVLS